MYNFDKLIDIINQCAEFTIRDSSCLFQFSSEYETLKIEDGETLLLKSNETTRTISKHTAGEKIKYFIKTNRVELLIWKDDMVQIVKTIFTIEDVLQLLNNMFNKEAKKKLQDI